MRLFGMLFRGSKAISMANAWEKDSRRLLSKMEKVRTDLTDLLAKIHAAGDRVDKRLDEADRLARQHEVVIEGLRNELKVLDDCTVKPLMAAVNRLTKQWDAEVAIQVRREVAATIPNREEL